MRQGSAKQRFPSPGVAKGRAKTGRRTKHVCPRPFRFIVRRKQVSRLGFILLARLPTGRGKGAVKRPPPPASAVASLRGRRLHGYWDSPELASAFPGGTKARWQPRAPRRRALLRGYAGYSFVAPIIPALARTVNRALLYGQGSRMNEQRRGRGLLCPQPQSAQVLRTLLVSADLTAHEISATGGHGRFVPLYP